MPPDQDALDQREQKILSAYQPTGITQHVVDSEMERVAKLVNQMYAEDPDWEPVVEKRGEHQYAISELRPRRKKESWEDDTPTIQQATDQGLMSGTSYVPKVTINDGKTQDPFFDKNGVADYTNNRFWNYKDFAKWTPGLERMFAPTNDEQKWY